MKAPQAPEIHRSWGFYLDGSFTSEPTYHRGLTSFIRKACYARQHEASPKAIAQSIPADLLAAFPCQQAWLQLLEWPSAPCSTSAESSIKYATV